MKYESRRCQTATYLSEVNSFSRAKYTDLKYVKRKKQYTSNSRTTFTTPINTETDLIIPNYIESESKMKNYLYMRNKRIKSGNRCYLRYPKLVKFTSDNSKEKLKAHFRPETARLNVSRGIDVYEQQLKDKAHLMQATQTQCDLYGEVNDIELQLNSRLNITPKVSIDKTDYHNIYFNCDNERNKVKEQYKKKVCHENKCIKEVLNKVARKIYYMNQHNETIYDDEVMNLLLSEAKEINETVEKNMDAYCDIKKFSIVLKNRENNKKKEVFLVPFINKIIKPFINRQEENKDNSKDKNNNEPLDGLINKIKTFFIKKNYIIDKEKKDESLESDKYHESSVSSKSDNNRNVYNNLLENFVKSTVDKFIEDEKEKSISKGSSSKHHKHHRRIFLKKSKSMYCLLMKEGIEAINIDDLDLNRTITDEHRKSHHRIKKSNRLINLKSVSKDIDAMKSNSIKDLFAPTAKLSSLINQLAGNHKLPASSMSKKDNMSFASGNVTKRTFDEAYDIKDINRKITKKNEIEKEKKKTVIVAKDGKEIKSNQIVDDNTHSGNNTDIYAKKLTINTHKEEEGEKEIISNQSSNISSNNTKSFIRQKTTNDYLRSNTKTSQYQNTEILNEVVTTQDKKKRSSKNAIINGKNKRPSKGNPKNVKFKLNANKNYILNEDISLEPTIIHFTKAPEPEITPRPVDKPKEIHSPQQRAKKINEALPPPAPITIIEIKPSYLTEHTEPPPTTFTKPLRVKSKNSKKDIQSSSTSANKTILKKLTLAEQPKENNEDDEEGKEERERLKEYYDNYKNSSSNTVSQHSSRKEFKTKAMFSSKTIHKKDTDKGNLNDKDNKNPIKVTFKHNTDISRLHTEVSKLKDVSIDNYIQDLKNEYTTKAKEDMKIEYNMNSLGAQERINEFMKVLIKSIDVNERKRLYNEKRYPVKSYEISNTMGLIGFPVTQIYSKRKSIISK